MSSILSEATLQPANDFGYFASYRPAPIPPKLKVRRKGQGFDVYVNGKSSYFVDGTSMEVWDPTHDHKLSFSSKDLEKDVMEIIASFPN